MEYDHLDSDPDRKGIGQMSDVPKRQIKVEPQQKRCHTRECENPDLRRPHDWPVDRLEVSNEFLRLDHLLLLSHFSINFSPQLPPGTPVEIFATARMHQPSVALC